MLKTLTVSAVGSVTAKPDMARISSGVVSEAKTAREALSANNEATARLIAALKKAGIAAGDLQTSSINVSPRYSHSSQGRTPQIDGYAVTNELSVVVRDVKRLGDILDEIVTLGANQIGGLSFEISDPASLKDEARKSAIAEARRRATLYAEAAGVTLGEVVTITEGSAHIPPRPLVMARAAMAESVPVEAGSQRLEIEVTVTWSLK